MIILCDQCDFRSNVYDDWIEHLVCDDHQKIVNDCINNWPEDLNERSLVVLIDGDCNQTKQDICWLFAKFGMITDVLFANNMEYCVIQLIRKDYAETALEQKHGILNSSFYVRLKSDISTSEWQALVTSNLKSFSSQHLKSTVALKFIPSLDCQFNYFIRQITMKSNQISVRRQLIKQIHDTLRRDFPKSVLYPHGDDASGLESSHTLNLHLYFDAYGHSRLNEQDSMDTIDTNLLSTSEILVNVEKALAKLEDLKGGLNYCDLTSFQNDSTARLEFTDFKSGIPCQLTFENLLEVQLSKLLAFLLKLDQRLSHLFRFINYWAEYHMLTESSSRHAISKNVLNILVICFLTKQRIIPSVSVLQSMSDTKIAIGEWDASFCTDVGRISNLLSFIQPESYPIDPTTGKPTANTILELIAEFFKFYAQCDFHSQVVCSFLGELLPKSIFEPQNYSELPKGLDVFKNWASVQEPEKRFNTDSPLCVQHPFDLGSNVSAITKKKVVSKFQFLCADTLEIMQSKLSSTSNDVSLLDIFKHHDLGVDTIKSDGEISDSDSDDEDIEEKRHERPWGMTVASNGIVYNKDKRHKNRQLKNRNLKANRKKRAREAILKGEAPVVYKKNRGIKSRLRGIDRLKEYRERKSNKVY